MNSVDVTISSQLAMVKVSVILIDVDYLRSTSYDVNVPEAFCPVRAQCLGSCEQGRRRSVPPRQSSSWGSGSRPSCRQGAVGTPFETTPI